MYRSSLNHSSVDVGDVEHIWSNYYPFILYHIFKSSFNTLYTELFFEYWHYFSYALHSWNQKKILQIKIGKMYNCPHIFFLCRSADWNIWGIKILRFCHFLKIVIRVDFFLQVFKTPLKTLYIIITISVVLSHMNALIDINSGRTTSFIATPFRYCLR